MSAPRTSASCSSSRSSASTCSAGGAHAAGDRCRRVSAGPRSAAARAVRTLGIAFHAAHAAVAGRAARRATACGRPTGTRRCCARRASSPTARATAGPGRVPGRHRRRDAGLRADVRAAAAVRLIRHSGAGLTRPHKRRGASGAKLRRYTHRDGSPDTAHGCSVVGLAGLVAAGAIGVAWRRLQPHLL